MFFRVCSDATKNEFSKFFSRVEIRLLTNFKLSFSSSYPAEVGRIACIIAFLIEVTALQLPSMYRLVSVLSAFSD